jgi:glyoxylase I family protein
MMPKIESLCPLFQVFDMPRSLALYRDVLGFGIVDQAPRGTDDCNWAWLRLGPAELMLNTMYEAPYRPQAPDSARVAAHDDTALYLGAPDVDAVFAYLRAKGFDVKEPVVSPYGMKQLYMKDPDGYNLCFQWRAA